MLGTAAMVHRFTGPARRLDAASWSPSGSILATATSRAVEVWDLTTSPAVPTTLADHTDRVTELAWSSDGAHLASAGQDGTVRLWRPAEADTPVGVPSQVTAVAWSADRSRLAWSAGAAVRVQDAAPPRRSSSAQRG